MATILPITREIEAACRELYRAVGLFLDARKTLPPLGRYESEVEAVNLFTMAIRHIEGVVALAREDLVLLPPALAAARAAFETSVKAAWMINVDDPFEREIRWLAHLKGEERFLERTSRYLADLGLESETLPSLHDKIRSFRVAVVGALPPGVAELPRSPSFEDMLKAVGGDELYVIYMKLSQYVHAEHAATWLYRSRGLGTEKRLGEFIKADDWYLPLRVCWLSLGQPGRVLLERTGASRAAFLDPDHQSRVVNAIEQVGAGWPGLRVH